jgi:hypothetical protein
MNIDRYNQIADLDTDFNEISIVSFIPSPKEEDFKRGYITRYFLRKSNDSNGIIYEIRKKSSSKFLNNSFYLVVSLDWRIKGDPIDIKKSNSESIRIASKTIPNISLYLPNLLQFYQK